MPETHRTRVLIIGAGPAGYTAAIYAARASLSPILVAGLQPGGQLTITTDVENYPGFADVDPGSVADGADGGAGRACRHADRPRPGDARPTFGGGRSVCARDSGDVYLADAVIIATGAQARWLGLRVGDSGCRARGVSACATCDGFFFRGKRWRSWAAATRRWRRRCTSRITPTHVTLIHRRDALRAEKILQARLFGQSPDQLVWDRVVEEIVGDGRAGDGHRGAAAQCANRRLGADCRARACSSPSATRPTPAMFAGQVAMDPRATSGPSRGARGPRSGGVCRRRRAGQSFPPGGHCRGHGLHGSSGGGKWLAGPAGSPDAADWPWNWRTGRRSVRTVWLD